MATGGRISWREACSMTPLEREAFNYVVAANRGYSIDWTTGVARPPRGAE